MELRVYLPGGAWPIRVTQAEIIWSHWDEFTVEFLDLPLRDRDQLQHYLIEAAAPVAAKPLGSSMVVRLEVQRPSGSHTWWQLRRCRVQRGAMMEDVRDPAVWLSMRFESLEETVREAKRATFTYLQLKRHKDMPDQIDWRIMDETHLFPCPQCQQPLYQKAKLGRFGNTLDLHDWGCPRCKKTVTLKTDDLIPAEHEPGADIPS